MIGKVSTFLGPNGLFQGTSASPSLVLSLDANNVLSYPGTGITWSDLTIFNNDTVFTTVHVGDPTYSISGGGSFQFGDFDDSFILSGSANGFPLGDSQYTIETWINPDNLSQISALVVYGTLGTNTANSIGLSNSSIIVDWVDNNLSSPTQSMIPGNWYYLSSTYDGTDRKIYLNGSLIASDTPGVTNSITTGDTFTIGNFMGVPFPGKISIVKLHTKALSAPRLLSNFNSLKNRFGYTFGSITLNGSNSYLSSTSADYAFGTNDFTIESFFRAATSSGDNYSGVISLRPNGEFNSGVGINIKLYNTPNPQIDFFADGEFGTYSIVNDKWYHAAISRTDDTTSFFVNGELIKQITDTYNYDCNDLVIGRYFTNVDDFYFNGLISNVRVINGTGLYTGTFSIPDVQLSGTESNTKLLIASQEMNPTADLTGLHSVTASNIGWTSSLPSITLYVTENLQFYVDAGLTESYSGTGTTWYDISGNSRNLTMDSLSYSSNNGGYIIFDGSHTADSVATYSINFSNGFTVESVAKFSGSEYEGLFAFNSPYDGDYINLQAQGGTNVRWEVEGGVTSLTSSNSLTSSTWYHFTCVYEGDSNNTSGTARIYINGVENGTASLSANRLGQIQTSNFVLGEHYGSYLTGNIALSRMYNNVLTPIEVLQNFNATKNRFGL
jgi:hypothetical protein